MTGIIIAIVRTSLFLGLSCCVGFLLLKITKCRSWRVHRTVWLLVLFTGIVPLSIPGWNLELAVLQEESEPVQTVYEEVIPEPLPIPLEPVVPPLVDLNNVEYIEISELDLKPFEEIAINEEPVTENNVLEEIVPIAQGPLSGTKTKKTSFEPEFWGPLGILCVWILGMSFIVARAVFRIVRFKRLIRDAFSGKEEWSRPWSELQEANGIKRKIPMWVSDGNLACPVLVRKIFGYVFLVPLEAWDRLSCEERTSVMRHELAHYLRGDIWSSLLARLLVLPHWFNPFSHFAFSRFEDAAEWACDEAAFGKEGESLGTFANALVLLHECSSRIPDPQNTKSVPGHRIFGSEISMRISRLLNYRKSLHKKESIMKKAFLLFTVLLLFASGFVHVKLTAQESGPKLVPFGTEITLPEETRAEPDLIPVPKKEEPSKSVEDLEYLALLSQKLKLSEEKLEFASESYKRGAGGFLSFQEARMENVDAKIEIYRYKNETESTLKALEEKLEIAKIYAEACQDRFRAGVAPNTEVIDAQKRLLETQLDIAIEKKKNEEVSKLQDDIPELLKKRTEILNAKLQGIQSRYERGTSTYEDVMKTRKEVLESEIELRKYMLESGDRSEKIEPDADFTMVLQKRYEIAQYELARKKEQFEERLVSREELEKAQLALLEAEFNLKKAIMERKEPKFVAQNQPKPKVLLFQGKTFEEWLEELEIELDPLLRAEAIRALAAFGAKGRGIDATKEILKAIEGTTYDRMMLGTGTPSSKMMYAAVSAFVDIGPHIPYEDSMPILLEKYSDGDKNDQEFVISVIGSPCITPGENRTLAKLFREKLEKWDIKARSDDRAYVLLSVMRRVDPNGKELLPMLENAIDKNDGIRFAFLFGKDGKTLPETVKIDPKDGIPYAYTDFAKALLELLHKKGGESKNEDIRKKSLEVLEFLDLFDEWKDEDNESAAETNTRVMIEGKPLAGATVVFEPIDGGAVLSGVTDQDGKSELKPVPGQYRITVSKVKDGVEHLDSKYTEPSTTPLMFDVQNGKNTFDIELE